ncbi:nitric oxide synthase oxygenase [Natronobacterium gregoryi]|uniref:Nitric oxide synthase oxygenase n=2 Tax=Natronobacterium gregoryi TaxID=44930 RepID=L0ALQ6_NATGS|nr:nitric oxide synthase oxygenase [Natronobacterium gregoryi]AFZ73990.1 nitric oxide synthase, oxygenase domain protein [Natronobacterium gregoryi SP2]ELY68804.1 nitric-oxide synthase [Natronobacterium gregoryi SP2]PLK18245.1 nitric oxide synthase oxygenase [Natronobacterium gregoryi SP2]SFJ73380.1 nitric-oxide synthase [Natronobacterium gregoryi]
MHAPVPEHDPEDLYAEAEAFVRQCYAELENEDEIEPRLAEIRASIAESGHYEHTPEELEHGARMAWRNSNRCIGRLFWETLDVIDARDADDAESVYDALCHHLEYATNDGDIRPTITVFEPMVRGKQQVQIWNHQLVRYAGYETDDGIVGDPAEVEFTEYCQSRGWEGDETDYDVLPLVVQLRDNEPELFEVPDDLALEVPIHHPDHDWIADLDLQWYAVPVISNMRLEIGGLQYTAAPFNGWYMATEIAARNFADEDRYDVLPAVADGLGLDTSRNRDLWKDEAIVELNRAVLHSYDRTGVRIVDHHTAAEQFEAFEQREEQADREVTGDWSWLIPPVSPASTHIFHKKYENRVETPNYFYREPPYEDCSSDSS